MSSKIINEIAEAVKAKLPEAYFNFSEEEENRPTIYPPARYYDSEGVTILIKDSRVELWREGRVLAMTSTDDVDETAVEIVRIIEEYEGYCKEDNEG